MVFDGPGLGGCGHSILGDGIWKDILGVWEEDLGVTVWLWDTGHMFHDR